MRARIEWVAAAVVAFSACDCGNDVQPIADGGPEDGGRPPWLDGDLPDVTMSSPDAGSRAPWPGWEPAPPFPASCEAWRPIAVAALPPLRWADCRVPEPGCEDLVVDWPVSLRNPNYLVARSSHQTSGPGAVLAFMRPVFGEGGDEWDESAVYTIEGLPIAAWRTITRPGTPYSCPMGCAATDAETVALGFHDLTTRDEDYTFFMLRDSPEGLTRVDAPALVLREPELLSLENGPNELYVDGESVVVHGSLGSVYLGQVGAGPWGEIGTGRTNDYENANGVFYEGAFYWSARPETDHRSRIRRRHPGAAANETVLDGRWFGGFRINSTWAFWLEYPDGPAPELWPEVVQVHAARTHGSTTSTDWTDDAVLAVERFPSAADGSSPVLHGDHAAYFRSDRVWEILDLAGRRRLTRTSESGVEWWATLFHFGPDYLIVAVRSPTGITTLRRYRYRDMPGWETIRD
jgi:hypothetical protein